MAWYCLHSILLVMNNDLSVLAWRKYLLSLDVETCVIIVARCESCLAEAEKKCGD